jgi:Secretion system C-terminal sorting domain
VSTKHVFVITLSFFILKNSFGQAYPLFGPEINVTISGLGFDAMEPFISPDESTLFFNSLNSEDTTDLYYATRVDDSTFTFVGLVGGIKDTAANHLDAVASLDASNNFYWTTLGDYPLVPETLGRGVYSGGNITDTTKVYGDFNVYSPGWLVMDAAISFDGNILAYTNAYFNGCMFGAPCIATIGLANKVNDSLFNKLPNTDAIFTNINDTSYIVYAPQLTQDGLEMYYTRLLKNTVNTEICVSVRNTPADTFSLPLVIHSNLNFTPEAATPTTDKQKIYYHQRNSLGIFELFLRYRTATLGYEKILNERELKIFPNPAKNKINVEVQSTSELVIYNLNGETVYSKTVSLGIQTIDLNFRTGVYILELSSENGVLRKKIIVE